MPRVHVKPLGIDIDVLEGESVMEAADRLGYYWPTVCGGVAMCALCFIRIEEGEEHVSAMQQLERDALENFRWRDGATEADVRLACQVEVDGDVTVYKRGVNQAGRAGTYR